MDLNLKGKNAIVTGGTCGIGRAITDSLADEGCNVAVCARNKEEILKTVDNLKSKGVSAIGGVVDVTDGGALREWINKAGTQLGSLDILVLNAGAMAFGADTASWEQNLRTDIFGAVPAIEGALPMLEASAKQNGDASIVVIVSAASATEPSSYGAMKGALVHYIKDLAKQNAPKHVRVDAIFISPGMICFKGGVWHQVVQGMPDFFKESLGQNPMGRMATPQGIANAVLFSASPCSSFTFGTNMIIDGVNTDRLNY